MTILLLVLFMLLLLGLKVKGRGFFDEYLSREQTNAIKGFFIGWVFLSHLSGYVFRSGYANGFISDAYFSFVNGLVGQLMVVMFLFYSGYGVMLSISKKGDAYVRSMPSRRILTTLLNFDVAVLVFVFVGLMIGSTYPIRRILLSLIAWNDVGNSNWYIFVIILCYGATWACAKLFRGVSRLLALVASLAAVMLVLSCVKGGYWYDTIMAFPAGCVYACYRPQLESFLRRHYWKSFLILMFVFLFCKQGHLFLRGIVPNIAAVAFAYWVVVVTMKIHVCNPILCWMGVHLFPIYIYQRIPMIALFDITNGAFIRSNFWLYAIACLLVTIGFAGLYRYWEIKLNGKACV